MSKDDDLNREMQDHLDLEAEERGGDRMAARRALGNLAWIQEETRRMWRWNSLATFHQDIRYALRRMQRDPGVSAAIVLMVALGVGANTAIFSLVDAILLKSLPVSHPETLVALDQYDDRGVKNFSHAMFEQLRDNSHAFSGMLAAEDGSHTVDMDGQEARLQLVSTGYFEVLSTNSFAGRLIGHSDEEASVVVLSHPFWQRRFNSELTAIGRQIRLKGLLFTIVGVTRPGFIGESLVRTPDMWTPIGNQPALDRGRSYIGDPNVGWLRLMARLRPGVDIEQARAQISVVLAQMQSQSDLRGRRARGVSRIEVLPGAQGLQDARARYGVPLRILMAGVALVLAIACANIANLLLARAAARQREVAIRLAIGAGRLRLIRQFLTESLVLSAAGGALGLLFAWWGIDALLVLASSGHDPLPIRAVPDLRILAFTFALSLATGIIFGIAPAWNATASPGVHRHASRVPVGGILVVAQISMTILLLGGAGLLERTLYNLRTVDLGFSGAHVLQVRVAPEVSERVLAQVAVTPGVISAAISGSGFGTGTSETCCIAIEGYTFAPGEDRQVQTLNAGTGYFETMGMSLVLGRAFRAGDLDKPVAIMNEAMARRFYGTTSPVGKRFGWGDAPSLKYTTEIIGVVRNVSRGRLREAVKPALFVPKNAGGYLSVRTAGDPAAAAAAVRFAIRTADPQIEIRGITTIAETIERSVSTERLLARLSTAFALLALLLAATGVYGLMAYTVARRVPEIGLRMALGAQRPAVVWMIQKQTLLLAASGVAIGVPASLAASRVLTSQLFQIAPNDPATLIVTALILVNAAGIAGYIPAWRASRVNPITALHHD